MKVTTLERAVPQIKGRPVEETIALIRDIAPDTTLPNPESHIGHSTNLPTWCDIVLLSPGYAMEGGVPRLLRLAESSRSNGAVSGGAQRAETVSLMPLTGDYNVQHIVCTSRRHHADDMTNDLPAHWEVQQQALVDRGVNPQLFRPDTVSIDTATEMSELLVRLALDPKCPPRVIVVTNRYHLPRAMTLARLIWLYGETAAAQGRAGFVSRHAAMVERLLRRTDRGYSTPYADQHVARDTVELLLITEVELHFVAAEDVLAAYNPDSWMQERGIYLAKGSHIRTDMLPRELIGIQQLLDGSYGLRVQ